MSNGAVLLSKMPRPQKTTERDRLNFRLDPSDEDTLVSFTTIRGEKIENMQEEYGFPSRASFLRCMVELGIQNFTREYVQDEDDSQSVGESEATTIREMVPEGEENAVDLRDELPEIIEADLLDIVDKDSEISRSGWEVYR